MKTCALLINFVLMFSFAAFAGDSIIPGKDGKPSVIIKVDDSLLSKKVSYTWGLDPFYKTPGFVKGTVKEPSFALKGIVHSEDDDSSAIINGKTVYVNSVIDGYAVREIGDNFVVVQKGDALRELQLTPIQNKVNSQINPYDRLPAAEPEESGVKK